MAFPKRRETLLGLDTQEKSIAGLKKNILCDSSKVSGMSQPFAGLQAETAMAELPADKRQVVNLEDIFNFCSKLNAMLLKIAA
jgi:hypothetical protein